MKILIVKVSALGDIIHSLPVAMAIYRQVPGALIDWVVEKPSLNLLEGHPALNKVILSPRHQLKKNLFKEALKLPGFIKDFRREKYDAVLDLQGLMKSSIFVLLSNSERKIGFKGGKEPLAAWPLSIPLPPYDIERHALDRYLDLLKPLGLKRPDKIEYGLIPRPEYLEKWEKRLAGSTPLIVLHPVAKWETKLWPEEHWAQLIKLLAAHGARLALSGAPDDRKVNQRIIEMSGIKNNIWDISGETTLQELIAVLSLADAVVSTDTGTMHLAAALQKPLVALFGPTAANRTGPYGQEDAVLSASMECRPCFQRTCSSHACMREISPQMVFEASLAKLNV